MARMTKQKQVMHDELAKFSSFFDAYELHEKVAKKNSKIGIATVYRFLNNLEDSGGVHSYLCDNKRIYSFGKKSHIHFTCENCNAKKHIDLKNVDFLKEVVDERICHFQIDLSGLCKNCR